MISGDFVSGGPKIAQGRRMLKSWTIIRIEEACYACTHPSRRDVARGP